MKIVDTITANIFLGLKAGYDGKVFNRNVAKLLCQEYVDTIGLAVTFTKTEFLYTKGNESGIIIGLINYPRFPSDYETIKNHAITLAKILQKNLKQYRVSIVMNDKTYMLEEEIDQ
jgi:hypothetical protein